MFRDDLSSVLIFSPGPAERRPQNSFTLPYSGSLKVGEEQEGGQLSNYTTCLCSIGPQNLAQTGFTLLLNIIVFFFSLKAAVHTPSGVNYLLINYT